MRTFNLESVFELKNLNIVITGRMTSGDIKVDDLIFLPDGNFFKVDKIQNFYKGNKIGDNIGILVGNGSFQPTKDYLKNFIKTNLEINDISEFRDKKLNKLGL
jgi:hypothetical protein